MFVISKSKDYFSLDKVFLLFLIIELAFVQIVRSNDSTYKIGNRCMIIKYIRRLKDV